ncbi:hydantoinase B/oxoprolinase family protein [Actinomadura sp.]|uniref:hydantoinase B/oxoprolinase family protein n=1 Tax=Actinomadura sp. TaxID=1989 RepID=UPI0037C9716E
MPESRDDTLVVELIRGNLSSTIHEMVQTTARSAYSTTFSEALDFSCALFDADALMICQAAGVPIHVGSMADVLDNVLAVHGRLDPGDVVLHNDPYAGGVHQFDVAVVRPMYTSDDQRLLGYAVNRGHWTDVGGSTAGGWSGKSTHVLQEGLLLPAVKIMRRGEVDRDIKELLLRNIRVPRSNWNDLQAQIASAITAERRVRALVDRYGAETVDAAGKEAIGYSRRRFIEGLAGIPDGTYVGEDVMDDDGVGGGPYVIKVTITKRADHVTVDFDGTSPQAAGPINAALACTKAAVSVALINVVDAETPINHGCLSRVNVRAQEGSLVNPKYPAPLFVGIADTTAHITEAVFRALAEAVPERVAAGSYASGNCTTGSGVTADGDEFVWYSFGGGGCGARAFADGNSVEWNAMGSCRNESVEIWEKRYPLRIVSWSLREGSGGDGKYRGGMGHVKAIQVLTETDISACIDRNQTPAFGLEGGEPGAVSRLTVDTGGGEQDFPTAFGTRCATKFGDVTVPADSIYRVYAAGGGGFGDPRERPASLRDRDRSHGYTADDA